MLYAFFKLILQPTLWVFFERIEVRGREHLSESGPLLVVANHPNTLMDPILVGMLWRRRLGFLAKSPFFKGVLKVILRSCGAIPLYRKQDSAPGEGPVEQLTEAQRAARNDESFRASFELLAEGGALLIFPEGSSVLERRLRPLKTGAARIALGAEARNNWGLGVRIVPVGLNYDDARRFRSRVFISVGEPLDVRQWRAAYEADSFGAAQELTEEIREALERQLLVTRSQEDDALIRALETLYKPHLRATPPPELAGQAPAVRDFELSRSLIEAVAWFEAREPARVNDIRRRVFAYQNALQRLGFEEDPLERAPGGAARRVPGPGRQLLGLVFGGPVWLWGAVNNYLPYWLPARVANRLTREVEFIAPIMMVTGMITFPLFYALQTWLVWRLTHSGLWAGLYLLSLPVTGFFALAFDRWLTAWRGQWRVGWLGRKRESLLEVLRQERVALLADLEQARGEWRAGTGREGS